ncbi:hypothetical protein Pmani_024667 [Petrolisthes manimaculis]|uniref:Uncharacterized protein n=1 Tax=Petrolisthes manimaculis TaxID=1843537 RepID=A0AAE1P771_9EUCA|nr:hypothetical protein Pmani_024667 [Petrolisthes manimaculis]
MAVTQEPDPLPASLTDPLLHLPHTGPPGKELLRDVNQGISRAWWKKERSFVGVERSERSFVGVERSERSFVGVEEGEELCLSGVERSERGGNSTHHYWYR